MEDLRAVYPDIISFPIEKQMQYADAITRRYALNSHFLETQKSALEDMSKPNVTAIGNLACLAYHNGLDSEYGILYKKIIKTLKEPKISSNIDISY